MNCLDLFSGAGGLTEGFIRAGYNIVAHIEKEFPASLTLKTRIAYHYLKNNDSLDIYYSYIENKISREKLYSYVPQRLLDSVINKEINDDTIDDIYKQIDSLKGNKKIDIIIGGPPCQAYSLIGRAASKSKMVGDTRKYLYKQYLKFLEKYQPKLFVFENVRGMLSSKDENGNNIFGKIVAEMKELGYSVDYKLLDAKDFGVPQSRKRVIIIGWKNNLNFKYPNFEKIKNNITINELFSDLPKIKAGEIINFKRIKTKKEILNKLHLLDDNSGILSQHISRPNNINDLKIYEIAAKLAEENKVLKYTDLPSSLINHKNLKSFLDRFKVVNGKGISHTMVAHISKDGHHYIHPDITQNRSITVREAARIQTFPDSYYFENSRTSAFIQIGNAVPPLMAEVIAKKIKETIN